jgi:hypothetical protein
VKVAEVSRKQKTRYPGIYRTEWGTYEVSYRDPHGSQRSKSHKRLQDALSFQREVEQSVSLGSVKSLPLSISLGRPMELRPSEATTACWQPS